MVFHQGFENQHGSFVGRFRFLDPAGGLIEAGQVVVVALQGTLISGSIRILFQQGLPNIKGFLDGRFRFLGPACALIETGQFVQDVS